MRKGAAALDAQACRLAAPGLQQHEGPTQSRRPGGAPCRGPGRLERGPSAPPAEAAAAGWRSASRAGRCPCQSRAQQPPPAAQGPGPAGGPPAPAAQRVQGESGCVTPGLRHDGRSLAGAPSSSAGSLVGGLAGCRHACRRCEAAGSPRCLRHCSACCCRGLARLRADQLHAAGWRCIQVLHRADSPLCSSDALAFCALDAQDAPERTSSGQACQGDRDGLALSSGSSSDTHRGRSLTCASRAAATVAAWSQVAQPRSHTSPPAALALQWTVSGSWRLLCLCA